MHPWDPSPESSPLPDAHPEGLERPDLWLPPSFPQDAGIILSLSALALFGVFLSNLLGILFGARALDPSWQLRLSEVLIGSAPFALLGSCLMLIAAFLDADQPLIEAFWLRTRQLAWVACLGYLLLIPLQASALLRLGSLMEQPAQQRIDRMRTIRDAIVRGRDREAINQALRDLPGSPQIPAGFSRPLDEFRRDASRRLDERLREMEREKMVATRFRRVGDALLFLRLGGISAILSGVFTAVAMRSPERDSWLEQLVMMRAARIDRRLRRSPDPSPGLSLDPYLDAPASGEQLDERGLEGEEQEPIR